MRFLTIVLIGGIIGLLVLVGYALLPKSEPVVDTGVDFPTGPGGEQVITEVPDPIEDETTPEAFERYFGEDVDPVMQTFVDTHLNENIFIMMQCRDSEELMLTLALNFAPNPVGLNTTEMGEQYLQDNFLTIAPYILTILGKSEYSEEEVVSNDYILFDRNLEIFRSVHAIDGEAHELFHTWIGNSVYFTKDLQCASNMVNDYYGSH